MPIFKNNNKKMIDLWNNLKNTSLRTDKDAKLGINKLQKDYV